MGVGSAQRWLFAIYVHASVNHSVHTTNLSSPTYPSVLPYPEIRQLLRALLKTNVLIGESQVTFVAIILISRRNRKFRRTPSRTAPQCAFCYPFVAGSPMPPHSLNQKLREAVFSCKCQAVQSLQACLEIIRADTRCTCRPYWRPPTKLPQRN